MDNPLAGDGKILGMPKKVAIPVLGVAVIAIVYVVLRGRSSEQPIPRAQPEEGGGFGGGGGGGSQVGGTYEAPPTDPIQDKLDRLYFEREQFQYNIDQRKESERQSGWEMQQEEQRSTLDAFLALLPFQLETQRASEEANQAGYEASRQRELASIGVDRAAADYATERYETASAGEDIVQRSIAGKKKVECPVGMHFVVNAEGGGQCQPLGSASGQTGFNPGKWISQAGNVLGGFLTGVGAAAPGIGYGAAQAGAQYGLAQAGIIPGATSRRPPIGTPGINPNPRQATPSRPSNYGSDNAPEQSFDVGYGSSNFPNIW